MQVRSMSLFLLCVSSEHLTPKMNNSLYQLYLAHELQIMSFFFMTVSVQNIL